MARNGKLIRVAPTRTPRIAMQYSAAPPSAERDGECHRIYVLECSPAPRPYVVSLASAMASSSVLNLATASTGPKISSVTYSYAAVSQSLTDAAATAHNLHVRRHVNKYYSI